MTIAPAPIVTRASGVPPAGKGSRLLDLLRTTDHKTIGLMYLTTALTWFVVGGLMTMLMRGELAQPGVQFLSPEQYNELFTMHGTIMLFFFATPLFFGFANLIMPLHIGAPDVAFPRLNAFSYWLFAFGGLIGVAGFLTPGGAADFGWTAYAPFSDSTNTPGFGANLWIVGLAVIGLGTILGGVNFVATIVSLRAPGLTMFRMPVFTWSVLLNSILVFLEFPILTAALMALRILIVAVADISRAIARNRPAVRVVRFPGGSATLSSPGERSVSPWRSDRLRGAVVVRSAPAGGAQRLMSHSRATSGGKRP